MAPDAIRVFLKDEYPQLTPKSRKNGWAFFLNPPQYHGVYSTRIIRVIRHNPDGITQLKRSVSARHNLPGNEIEISGDAEELREIVDKELELFRDPQPSPNQ